MKSGVPRDAQARVKSPWRRVAALVFVPTSVVCALLFLLRDTEDDHDVAARIAEPDNGASTARGARTRRSVVPSVPESEDAASPEVHPPEEGVRTAAYDPAPTTEIRVSDAASGAPVADARAQVRDGQTLPTEGAPSFAAAEDGVIRLPQSRTAALSFVVTAPGRLPVWLSGIEAGTRTDVRLEQGVSLLVRCVDATGARIDADWRAFVTQGEGAQGRRVCAERGNGGEFRLTLPAAGDDVELRVEMSGFQHARLRLPLWGAGERSETILLNAPPCIRGVTRDAVSEAVVAGVVVEGLGGTAVSDSEGRFVLPTPRATAHPVNGTVTASHRSYEDSSVFGTFTDTDPADIPMKPARSLVVVVRGSTLGDAASEFRVSAVGRGQGVRPRSVARLDDRPAFRIEGLTTGEYYVGTVTAPDGHGTPFLFRATEGDEHEVSIEVLPARTVRGRALDRAGRPITGAYCRVNQSWRGWQGTSAKEDHAAIGLRMEWIARNGACVLLDDQGRFEARAVPGTLQVRIVASRRNGESRVADTVPVVLPAGEGTFDLGDLTFPDRP